ncbi:hypothetical protein [Virgibacillus sp. SK37]|uniref:hypothetical protein n=1 Tax=Virgibacillus sp. SK37 TaxID=403957 RepID=UPI0004D178A7|nr:hypothetical protein [Virgibacillus sp. SK37]AIF45417.1 hypothetical protein X953_10065 [Virgibacillus sp. SK37]
MNYSVKITTINNNEYVFDKVYENENGAYSEINAKKWFKLTQEEEHHFINVNYIISIEVTENPIDDCTPVEYDRYGNKIYEEQ